MKEEVYIFYLNTKKVHYYVFHLGRGERVRKSSQGVGSDRAKREKRDPWGWGCPRLLPPTVKSLVLAVVS